MKPTNLKICDSHKEKCRRKFFLRFKRIILQISDQSMRWH